MQAKYYIYRNLRTGGFSIKYRGRVVDRMHKFTAMDISFSISESRRQRVIREKRKNVHAFVVAERYKGTISKDFGVDKLKKITYNPYNANYFTCEGKEINTAQEVVFYDGKCYLIE